MKIKIKESATTCFMHEMPLGSIGVVVDRPYEGAVVYRANSTECNVVCRLGGDEDQCWSWVAGGRVENKVRLLPKGTKLNIKI